MDQAKAAVKNLLHSSGKHDTTVHERVQPAVTNETVNKESREEQTTAVDREVHQDHYHTSVQPIKHQETLPEQHHHQQTEVQHRNYEHDDADSNERKLAQEAARFKNTSTRVEGATTTTTAPTVAGEHVHHHVHENIQPVIEKQTIEPHVVHTTVPVHEVHHNPAKHHTTSALPTVSMNEFQRAGGVLNGREEYSDRFDGEPRAVGQMGANSETRATSNNNSTLSSANQSTSRADATSGMNNSQTAQKASLMDNINPSKDTDGDGKKGFMS